MLAASNGEDLYQLLVEGIVYPAAFERGIEFDVDHTLVDLFILLLHLRARVTSLWNRHVFQDVDYRTRNCRNRVFRSGEWLFDYHCIFRPVA